MKKKTIKYSWVPVLDDNEDNYVPGQYETKDIYQGEDCLPMFDTKEECEQWCYNKNYVGRYLKALKNWDDENNQASLKPGDYIQITEIVDGIGLGYSDGKKHLLFNTKHIDSWLSLWELMPQDFNPLAPKVGDVTHKGIIDTIGNCANCGVEFHIHKDETKSIVNQITDLENQSFDGWSDDAINGYLTACKTIKALYHVVPSLHAVAYYENALSKTAVSGSSFEHYMIYVDNKLKLDVYSFAEVQDYYDKYKLYGKITYEKVS